MKRLLLTLVILTWAIPVGAAPDTTMTITPTPVSGTTITAADETSRNANISTPYNSHSHTDISATTANTYTIGDGTAGAKALAIDNEFTTTPSIRYNNVTEAWQFSNDASTFLEVFVNTNNQWVMGDGTSTFKYLFIDDDTTTSPAIRYNTVDDDWEYSADGNDYVTFDKALGYYHANPGTDFFAMPYNITATCGAAAEADCDNWVAPMRLQMSNLTCNVTNAPGAGETWRFTIRDDGAATPLTCDIAGAAEIDCIDDVNVADIGIGSRVYLHASDVAAAAAAGGITACTVRY